MTAAAILCFSALGFCQAQEAPAPADDSGAAAQEPGMNPQQPGLVMPPDQSDALPEAATPALAQPAPATGIAPPTTPDEAGTLEQTIYGEDEALAEEPAQPVAQSRPWKFNLHATAGAYYDTNIFISSTDRKSDFITVLSAGGGLTLGDYTARENNYLITDYTGIYNFFARNTSEDAYEQNAMLEGQLVLSPLTLHGEFQFQDLADDSIDVGTRARRQIYTGNGSARYDISDKTYLVATGQVIVSNYDLYYGSNDERGGLFFDYVVDPNVTVGIGGQGGVLNVQHSGSQTYEQLLGTCQISVTGKFSLQGTAGVEDRQTEDNSGLVTPYLQLTGDYKPMEGLDLSLTAYSQMINSASYLGTDYIGTGIDFRAAYELSARFTLLLQAGYANDDYRDVASGSTVSRDDNYFYIRPGFRYTASPYCYLELYYFYRNNDSSINTASFNDMQIGMTVNVTF